MSSITDNFNFGFLSEFEKIAVQDSFVMQAVQSRRATTPFPPTEAKSWKEKLPKILGLSGLGLAGGIAAREYLRRRRRIAKPEEDQQKTAELSDKQLRYLGLGLAASPIAIMGGSKLLSAYRVGKNKKYLKAANPHDVAKHPLFEQQFNSLKRFSPKVAADPLAAAHALRKMQHSSQGLLDILKDVHQLHTEDAERRTESRGLVGETGERLLGGVRD